MWGKYYVIVETTEMSLRTEMDELVKQYKFTDDSVLLEFFDKLAPVQVDEMIGKWKGGDFDTGRWQSKALTDLKWFGKYFKSQLDGKPLVCYNDEGKLYSSQAQNGESSLWMIEFRGKTSATMVYDGVPIFDHFRKVDENLVFGIMNGKNLPNLPVITDEKYYYFYLERVSEFPVEFVENE